MRERPILFSAPMVRAILEGRKTQTRRVIKPEPKPFDAEMNFWEWPSKTPGAEPKLRLHVPGFQKSLATLCPYGRAGDRLWVRETWHCEGAQNLVRYRATGDALHELKKWRPSIFMPRWASRITLEISEVRVQRLLDITEADAIAEGVSLLDDQYTGPVDAFRCLWNSINGDGSWDSNPWCWALKFRRIKWDLYTLLPP